MVRIDGTDIDYIKSLLTEMEINKYITYDITIRENRVNSEIEDINISVKQAASIDF